MYPTGPRADRRPIINKDPKDELPVLRSSEFVKIAPPSSERWAKAEQQPGPKGRYGVAQLELDVSLFPARQLILELTALAFLQLVRYRSTRVHINQDYDQKSRNTRRALHELDMATIDLRMAETRKKIAGVQLEKAKHGMLGIDAVPPDATPDS